MKKDLLHSSHSKDLETPKWKVASDKISELTNAGKENSIEYYLAYAEYYEAMISMEGDSNGYYWGRVQFYREKAKQLETNSL